MRDESEKAIESIKSEKEEEKKKLQEILEERTKA